MIHPLIGKQVHILRGKQRGHTAEVLHETKPHPISSKRRLVIHLNTWNGFWDRRTLIMNEDGLEELIQ